VSTVKASRILFPPIFFRPSQIGNLVFMHGIVVEASPGQKELNIENLVVRVPVRL